MSEFIGSLISLISKSDIRYEGTLHEINPSSHTVALEHVSSFGTEGRRGGVSEIEPSSQIYDYIIFRGSDVKELSIVNPAKESKPAPPPAVPNDPAILGSTRAPLTVQQPSQPIPLPPVHHEVSERIPVSSSPNFNPQFQNTSQVPYNPYRRFPYPSYQPPHKVIEVYAPIPNGRPPNFYGPPRQPFIDNSPSQKDPTFNVTPPQFQQTSRSGPSLTTSDQKSHNQPIELINPPIPISSNAQPQIPIDPAQLILPTNPPELPDHKKDKYPVSIAVNKIAHDQLSDPSSLLSHAFPPSSQIPLTDSTSTRPGQPSLPPVSSTQPSDNSSLLTIPFPPDSSTFQKQQPSVSNLITLPTASPIANKPLQSSTFSVANPPANHYQSDAHAATAAVAAAMAKLPIAPANRHPNYFNNHNHITNSRPNYNNYNNYNNHPGNPSSFRRPHDMFRGNFHSRVGYSRSGGGGGPGLPPYRYHGTSNNNNNDNNHHHHHNNRRIEIPSADFDFEQANKKFDKLEISSDFKSKSDSDDNGSKSSTAHRDGAEPDTKPDFIMPAGPSYDKGKSFFDTISSDLKDRAEAQDRRGKTSDFVSDERRKNMETFGQSSVDSYRFRGRGRGRGRPRGRGYGGGGNTLLRPSVDKNSKTFPPPALHS